MSRARRVRRQQRSAAQAEIQSAEVLENETVGRLVRWAVLWIALSFLVPNLGTLACRFVFDDRVLIVENQLMHPRSFGGLLQIWKSGYWPDNRGLELYRPVSQTVWALIWSAGGGTYPAVYHLFCLAAGLAVVLLLYRFLLAVETPPRIAFAASCLFALFPIHTDATASVVGSAELMAAAFALGALLFYYRGRSGPALALFALAVLSKESAAAFAALPLVFRRRRALDLRRGSRGDHWRSPCRAPGALGQRADPGD